MYHVCVYVRVHCVRVCGFMCICCAFACVRVRVDACVYKRMRECAVVCVLFFKRLLSRHLSDGQESAAAPIAPPQSLCMR